MELSLRKLGLWVGELSLAEAVGEKGGGPCRVPQEQSVPAVEPEKDSSESQGVQGGREETTQFLSVRKATMKRAGWLPGWSICPRRLSDGHQHLKEKRCEKGQTTQIQS